MTKKFVKVLLVTMAATAVMAGSAFAEPMTDASRSAQRALDGRAYIPIAYTAADFTEAREITAQLGGETPFEVADSAYVALSYTAEDFTQARAVTAETSKEMPFDLADGMRDNGVPAGAGHRLAGKNNIVG